MQRLFFRGGLLVCLMFGLGLLARIPQAQAGPLAQIPTGSVPTVTGTPMGAFALVLDNEQGYANVRAGPHSSYEIVGSLLIGQQVPALGRSPGGSWIQISYPGVPGGVGWVWKDLVDVKGNLPIVEPPPTPTPRTTATIDPTLAAQFQLDLQPTGLPTYTPPPPISIPTFPAETVATNPGRVPMGLLIIGMAVVGVFGTLLSFLRGR